MPRGEIDLFPYIFRPRSAPPLAAEWGCIKVPENRAAANKRYIFIPFIRFKCRSKKPAAPIVFLQGGPGESLLPYLPDFWERPMWRPNLDIADFIFIEQRGYGLSRPSLECPGVYNLSLKEPGSASAYTEAERDYLLRACDFWVEQGMDPAGYNALEMAADINDLRQALGYEKISLFGGSFGSHHGFALLRHYGDFIERAFFFGVEGPNHTIKLPEQVQACLLKYRDLYADAHKPGAMKRDLLDLMSSVMRKLENWPVTVDTIHPVSKKAVKITIGKYDLQLATSRGLGNTGFISELPARYLKTAQGDFSWLADEAIKLRVDRTGNLMYALTDCASGATAERRQLVASQAPAALLGNTINDSFHEMCGFLPGKDLGDDYRGELKSDTPLMLVCGSLDARTPVSNAKEMLSGFSNGQLIEVGGVSHDISIHGDHIGDLVDVRDRFFRGDKVECTRLKATFSFRTQEK